MLRGIVWITPKSLVTRIEICISSRQGVVRLIMTMNPSVVAHHEAGHAVMQWMVGWESEMEFIQMQRVAGGVVNCFMKVPSPNFANYSVESFARRQLLVLLAGAATTDNPRDRHNKGDFDMTCLVLSFLFSRPISWKPGIGIAVVEESPNFLLQAALETCMAIVWHELIQRAIRAVAERLLNSEPDERGVCRIYRDEVVEICQDECASLRMQNEWGSWMDARC